MEEEEATIEAVGQMEEEEEGGDGRRGSARATAVWGRVSHKSEIVSSCGSHVLWNIGAPWVGTTLAWLLTA